MAATSDQPRKANAPSRITLSLQERSSQEAGTLRRRSPRSMDERQSPNAQEPETGPCEKVGHRGLAFGQVLIAMRSAAHRHGDGLAQKKSGEQCGHTHFALAFVADVAEAGERFAAMAGIAGAERKFAPGLGRVRE